MERLLIFISTVLPLSPVTAQVSVGTDAVLFVGSGATVSFDGLVMQPSVDLALSELIITATTTPLTAPVSIARVYTLSTPVGFTGTLGIRYDSGELNGLPAEELQIATQAATNGTFTPATNSVADVGYVSAVYNDEVNIRRVISMKSGGAMPVSLVDFSVRKEEQHVLLSWYTTAEINASHFDIERSADSRAWQKIGQVAARGTETRTAGYNFRDRFPLSPQESSAALRYYRLKMMDLDGTFSYSEIRSLRLDGSASAMARIYPNPASDYIKVKTATGGLLSVSDVTGRRLREINAQVGINEIDVRNLPAGVYLVSVNGISVRWLKL